MDLNNAIQSVYDKMIAWLDIKQIKCPDCGHAGFVYHGFYKRWVILEIPYKLVVTRIQCPNCKKTHAILPQWLIPYVQIPLKTVVHIVQLKSAKEVITFLDSFFYISEETVKRIKTVFKKYWKPVLEKENIPVTEEISSVCLDKLKRQFMQMKRPFAIAYRQYHIEYPSALFSP